MNWVGVQIPTWPNFLSLVFFFDLLILYTKLNIDGTETKLSILYKELNIENET